MPRRLLPLFLGALLLGCGGDKDAPGTGDGSTKTPPVIGKPADEEEAAQALGFPAFATKNTTRVGGADPVADAAGVARAVFPGADSRPQVVVLVDVEDWRAAISAAQLAGPPLRAAILFTRDGELPPASQEALEALDPRGAEKAGKAEVIRIGAATAVEVEQRTTDVTGTNHVALARAIDRLQASAAGEPSEQVIVAPADDPGLAMPAAALAAHSGAPVLWSARDSLPSATRQAIESRGQARAYVLAPPSAITDKVLEDIGELGAVRRVDGADPAAHSVAVARFADGNFGWNVTDPGHGLVFASSERPADAAAAAPLSAAGTHGPLLLLPDAEQLPAAIQGYLLDIQPGYERDPVRGVYNHGWLIGDEEAISVEVQSRIDGLLEIQPVERSPDA